MPAASELEHPETWRGESAEPDDGRTVAVAESCTGGLLTTKIVETPGSGDWFKGGLVAYDAEVKYRLLGVPEGPVITREAAMDMARGVRELFATDVGVATTGVAGPEPEEGEPVGTVFVGVADESGAQGLLLSLEGSPDEVRQAAARHGLGQVFYTRELSEDLGGARQSDVRLSYGLAIPEGGFAILSPRPLDDVSIVGSSVGFSVPGAGSELLTIEIVGLHGSPSPKVLLTQSGAEAVTRGRTDPTGHQVFDVPSGIAHRITWTGADLSQMVY